MQDPYKTPDAPPPSPHSQLPNAPVALKHSGFGVASFIAGISCIVGFIAMCVISAMTVSKAMHRNSNDDAAMDQAMSTFTFIGFVGVILCLLAVIGTVLGIVGILQRNRKRLFGILGLTFSGLFILGILGIIVLGALSS